jgi:hypothetical protein
MKLTGIEASDAERGFVDDIDEEKEEMEEGEE